MKIYPVRFSENIYAGNQGSFVQKNNYAAGSDIFLKNNFKIEEKILKDAYLGNADVKVQRYLNEPQNIKRLFDDPIFVKASVSALRKSLVEKLKEANDDNEKETLIFLISLLGEEEKHLDLSIKALKKDKRVRNKISSQSFQPAFGIANPFNYGFFIKPDTREKRAEAIVNRRASLAAAESAILLQAGPAIETSALTLNTIKMCHEICDTYQMSGGAVSSLVAQLTGSFAGKTLANFVLDKFPGLGNLANATITYTLHEITGRAIITWCKENYKNQDIKDWDAAARTLRFAAPFILSGKLPSSLDDGGETDVW